MKMPQAGGPEKRPREGVVVAVRPRELTLRMGREVAELPLPGRLKKGRREETNPIAVGDRLIVEPKGGRLRVKELIDRTNEISRADSLRPPRKHVLASNVDLTVCVVSAHEPDFNARLLDRLLLLGEVAGVAGVVCVNKWDLVALQGAPSVDHYEGLGYRVVRTSAKTGLGVDGLEALLKGRVAMLVGSSGVGKSTLINRIIPEASQRTSPISETSGRGVHTTTRVDWLDVPGGGVVLDTPGLRHIRPWGLERENLASFFPEIGRFSGGCRFRNCIHRAEPGCAVRDELEAHAELSARYDSYLRILESLESEELW